MEHNNDFTNIFSHTNGLFSAQESDGGGGGLQKAGAWRKQEGVAEGRRGRGLECLMSINFGQNKAAKIQPNPDRRPSLAEKGCLGNLIKG